MNFLANKRNYTHTNHKNTTICLCTEAPTLNFSISAIRKDLQIVQVLYAQGHNAQLKTCAPTYNPITIYIHGLQMTPPLAKVRWRTALTPPQIPPQVFRHPLSMILGAYLHSPLI